MVIKKLGQIQQKESKNKTSTKKHKRGWLIFGGVVVTLAVIGHIGNVMEQSRLEKDNVPIIISNVDENIKLDYHTDKREISAKISGVSLLAEVKVANGKTSIHGHKNSAGDIKYEIKGIKEGDSDISISVVDGKRHGDKIIKIHRQTKADYDKQELEKALKRAEESVKKAEQKLNDENISRAKSDINKLPEDKRGQFSERIAKLEKPSRKRKNVLTKPRKRLRRRKNKRRQRLPQLKLGSNSSKRDRSLHLAKLPLLLPPRNQFQQLLRVHVHAQQHLHPLPRQNYILVAAKKRVLLAIAICAAANRGIRRTLIETVTA